MFVPNAGGQSQFMDDFDHPYVALAGGWYAGKTWAGARKTITLHVHNAFDGLGQPTFVKGLVVGQNYSLARQVNIPEIMLACDEAGLPYKFVPDPKRYCFEFPDLGTKLRPSELLIRSADSPETINAFTVGHVWGDETPRWPQSEDDPKRDALLQSKGRMRDPRAKILQMNLTFTHEGDGTRVYRDFEETPLPGHVLYRAGTFENPSALNYADMLKGQLSPELSQQYLSGMAVNLRGGKVYGSFDFATHVDSSVRVRSGMPLHFSMDFNICPGMHGLLGQYDGSTDNAVEIAEFYEKDLTIKKMIEVNFVNWLMALPAGVTFPELHLFGDPSGKNRSALDAKSYWDWLRQWFNTKLSEYMPGCRVRYRYETSDPGIQSRVNVVNCALRTIDGRVRYRIHPDCKELIQDLRVMKWEEGEMPEGDRSHSADAIAYRLCVIMPLRRIERRASQFAAV